MSSKLQEIWNRIEVENENIQMETQYDYEAKYLQTEMDVEDALIQLQGQINQQNEKAEVIKINRLVLPKFNGDYFKWITFRDLFKNAVLDKNYSKVEKMLILKTHLTGEAETLVGDLTISEANLDCAWDRIMSRYENNKVVVYKLLEKLMNQPTGKNEAKFIKKLLDSTDQTILALNNLGRPTDLTIQRF